MSWLTPFQNLIIRFKIGSGGSSSGGITEELLNSKLAAFYTATETKILNLVNSKLATYVTQTAFNELETKVETNTTNISNLGNNITTNTNNINSLTTRVTALENTKTGNNLSLMYGKVWLSNYNNTTAQVQFQTGSIFYTNAIDSLILNNGTTISLNKLNKYLISFDYGFNAEQFANGRIRGELVKADIIPHLGYITNSVYSCRVTFIATENTSITWKEKPYFQVVLLLSNSVENITKTLKYSNELISETNENNILEITSWVNL